MKQAYAIGDVLFSRIQTADVPNDDLCRLTQAWDQVKERERILRGRPLPGSLKPVAKRKVRRSYSPIIEEPIIDTANTTDAAFKPDSDN